MPVRIELFKDKVSQIDNSSNTSIFSALYKDTRSEILITKSELDLAGFNAGASLMALDLFMTNLPNINLENVKIGIKHSTKMSLSLSSFDLYDTYQEVFNGTIARSSLVSNKWNTFNFISNFVWNGNDNILLTLIKDGITSSTGGSWQVREVDDDYYTGYNGDDAISSPFDTNAEFVLRIVPSIRFLIDDGLPNQIPILSDITPSDTSVSELPEQVFTVIIDDPEQDSVGFNLQMSRVLDFSTTVLDYNSPIRPSGVEYSVRVTSLSGTYYWRIRGFDSFGAQSAFSDTRSLTIEETVITPITLILKPDEIKSQINVTGGLSNILTADSNWLTAIDKKANTEFVASFPTPPGQLVGGAKDQLYRIQFRKTSASTVHPKGRISFFENGVLISRTTLFDVTSTVGTVFRFTFDSALLQDPTGAGIEVKVEGFVSTGTGEDISTVEFGLAEYTAYLIQNAPVPTIVSVSKSKISDKYANSNAVIEFNFDIDIVKWRVNVFGSDAHTGLIADEATLSFSAGSKQLAVISNLDLYQEGENRINVYGKNSSGVWTPHGG